MYDSLLLLLVMIAGILAGHMSPGFAEVCRRLQSGAVMVLLFAMGVSMRSFTDTGSGLNIWVRGAIIALAAVAGSVVMARVYRRIVYRGDEL